MDKILDLQQIIIKTLDLKKLYGQLQKKTLLRNKAK